MNEEAFVFGSAGALVGVLSRPAGTPDPGRPALVVLNAGLVHRVGPQRLHVALLRRMAAQGFTGLRFDFSGIGDSLPRADMMPYTRSTLEELREAMDAITARTGIERFCVLGLSSGALVSMASAGVDARVVGVCMLNPHGFGSGSVWGEHVDALHTGRVYARNLLSLESWRKLLTGRTNYRRLWQALRYRLGGGARAQQQALSQVAQGARPVLTDFFARGVRTLLVFSQRDRSQQNFDEILGRGWRRRLSTQVEVAEIADANHTFASPAHQQQAIAAIEAWLLARWPAPAAGAAPAAARTPRPAKLADAAPGASHGL